MTLSRRWVRGAVWVVLLTVGSVLAHAQEVSGSISGTVVSDAGAGVSGAVVTLTQTDRARVERTLKTDKAGFYSATSLPLGNYSVAVAMQGFKTTTVTGVVLHADDELKIDQKLAAGGAGETVSVAFRSVPPSLANSTSEGLVSGTQVHDLMLDTRNYEQLLTLQPGVSYGGTSDQLYIGQFTPSVLGSSSRVEFSINGQRAVSNNWMVDGADNVNRGGENTGIAQGGFTLDTFPSVDAISEIVTLRGNYGAEYGRDAGGQISVITKSGTNAFHGSAFEFWRNDQLEANNYFNNLVGNARPDLRYNDFGFTLGGPVIIPHFYNGKSDTGRFKTYFFYSQEFRRVVSYSTYQVLVPNAAELAGNFGTTAVCQTAAVSGQCTAYATGTTDAAFITPTSQAYINDVFSSLAPSAGDAAAGLDPHTLVANTRNTYNDAQELARIDQTIGKKVNVFYRYLHDSLPSTEGGGLFIGNGLPGVSNTATTEPGTQHVGHMTIAARPTMIIDLGYGFSSGGIYSNPVGLGSLAVNSATATPISSSMLLPYVRTVENPIPALGIIPSLTFAGVSGSNTPTGISNTGIYNELSVNHNGFGDITEVIRQHTLKFGMSYNHLQVKENATGNAAPFPQGNFTFTPSTTPTAAQLTALGTGVTAASAFDSEFANFLIGNANGGFTQGSRAVTADLNQNQVEVFLQDDWKASRRLTLNLGVRYSFFGGPFDDNNQLSNFDPATFTPVHDETVDSNGNLCTLFGQTTPVTVGTTTTYTLANCANANGLDNVNGLATFQPNSVADPLDGIILGNPGEAASRLLPFIIQSGEPSISTHGSPWGNAVGHAEKHDFAPRVGFAYDLFGDGKTALRGGYGMVYDSSATTMYEQEVFNNTPYLIMNNYVAALLSAPTCPSPALQIVCSSSIAPAAGGVVTPFTNKIPPALYGSPVIYQTPYVQQFSLDLQQAITPTTTLDVGYFGDHGTHLLGRIDINEALPGAFAQTSIGYTQVPGCAGFTSQACGAPLNQIRPYQGYTAINSVESIFNSNYNALQVKVTRKFSGNSMIDANYTFSRSLSNASTDLNSAPQNSYNLAQNYGPTAYNRNDVLTIDGIWDLPWYRDQKGVLGVIAGGWELSGIYVVNSGQPLTVTMSGGGTVNYQGLTSVYNGQTSGGIANDAAGLGIGGTGTGGPSLAAMRPSVVLNPNAGYGQVNLKKRLNWFNQTAFVAPSPASYQAGNERTGMMDGPGYNRLDTAVFRSFKLYRQVVFQFRGEAFNVLNHTNWASVSTNATSSSFGQVIGARDPRIIQLGGKVTF